MTEIDCGEITLIRFDNGRIAEIIINSTVEPISADELVRVMTMNGSEDHSNYSNRKRKPAASGL